MLRVTRRFLYPWFRLSNILHNHNALRVWRHSPPCAMMLHFFSESRPRHPECTLWTKAKPAHTHTQVTWPFTFYTCDQTPCHPPRCVSCWGLCQPWLTGWQGDAVMIHAWPGGLTAGYLQHHTWVPWLAAMPAKLVRLKAEHHTHRDAEIQRRLYKIEGGHWIWMCDSQT